MATKYSGPEDRADASDSVLAAGDACSWLPGMAEPTATPVDAFLESLGGRMRMLGCRYAGAQLRSVEPFEDGGLEDGGAAWTSGLEVTRDQEDPAAINLALAFQVVRGEAGSAGVALAFDFSGWSTENYILVPGMVYDGNRFRILPLGYPPYIHDQQDRPLDMPITTTNIVHLNRDGSNAKIEMNTGNVATPMLSFFNPEKQRGFILLAEQRTRYGNNGLFIEEDAGPAVAEKRITFVVSAPGVREQRYRGCGRAPSGDLAADWQTGDGLRLRFKVYNFHADDLPAFYGKVFDVRKALTGPNTYTCVTPYSVCSGLITEHHDRHKWHEKDGKGYYCNGPGSTAPFAYQIGWSGVPVYGFPCLVAETPERLRRIGLSLDNMLIRGGQGKSGLYYAMNRDGEILGDTFATMEEHRSIAMIRRSAEVLYFGLRTLDLMRQRGHVGMIKPEWEQSFRACADGLMQVWKAYGQFGQFIDVDSGRMEINGSCNGSGAGAALALAARYFQEPRYLETAEDSMKWYYDTYYLKGYSGGGPAEILQAPDSESAANMVLSCIELYELTGKQEWLDRATFATHMLATWTVSYDYVFPVDSDLGKAGVQAAGSIFASSQNNHSAPGFYILSGDFLLKLFRATGDKRIADLYKDQSHNVVQYAGSPSNPLHKVVGTVTERVQLSDWEGKNKVGSVSHADTNMAWETLVALTCLENPGIYLHTDDDTFLVMDHVEATVVDHDRHRGTKTVRIVNPTACDATVSIFAETARQAKTPLGWGASDRWPRVPVKAGETLTVDIGREPCLTHNKLNHSLRGARKARNKSEIQ